MIITEFWSGIRGGTYYYVIDDDRLVHISRYASSSRRFGEMIKYIIDEDNLRGKYVVEICGSKHGGPFKPVIMPFEDLILSYNSQRRHEATLKDLSVYKLEIPEADRILDEWRRYYIGMISYIREFELKYDIKVLATPLVRFHFDDPTLPISIFVQPRKSRDRSFEQLAKQLHQIWIAALILDISLGWQVIPQFFEEHYLHFNQSSDQALAVIQAYSNSIYSVWYEFDLNPHTMCRGIFWHGESSPYWLRMMLHYVEELSTSLGLKRLPLRPDIVLLNGVLKTCKDIMSHGLDIEVLIECKNKDFRYWKKDLENQVIPYAKLFRPKYFILTSLKPVPDMYKRKLDKENIVVIDNVYPGGEGEKIFIETVKNIL